MGFTNTAPAVECEINTVCKNLGAPKNFDKVNRDWNENLYFNSILQSVKIDSGAQANVISKSTVDKVFPKVQISPTNVKLSAYGGFSLPVIGSVKIYCSTIH